MDPVGSPTGETMGEGVCGGVCMCVTTGNTCSDSLLARLGDAEPQQVESAGSNRRKPLGPQVYWILQPLTKFESQNLCIFMNV